MITVLTILVLVSAASIGVMGAYGSELIQSVRKFFLLSDSVINRLEVLRKPSFWKRFMKGWFFLLLPIMFVMNIWYWFGRMTQCELCLSTHVAWLLLWATGHELLLSIIISPAVIPLTLILNKLFMDKH